MPDASALKIACFGDGVYRLVEFFLSALSDISEVGSRGFDVKLFVLQANEMLLMDSLIIKNLTGKAGWAAPRLKDANLSEEKLRESYVEVLASPFIFACVYAVGCCCGHSVGLELIYSLAYWISILHCSVL